MNHYGGLVSVVQYAGSVMRNNSSTIYGSFLLIGDFFALLGAFVIAYIFRVSLDHRPIANQIGAVEFLQIFTLLVPIVLLIFASLGLYSRAIYDSRVREFGRLIVGSFIGILTVISYDYISNKPILPGKLVALYALLLGFTLLILERSVARWLRTALFSYGVGINKILIVGSGRTTNELIEKVSDTKHTGQKVVAVIGKESPIIRKLDIPVYESIDNLKEMDVDTVIQTSYLNDDTLTKDLIARAQDAHIAYQFLPEQTRLYSGNASVELYQGLPIVSVHPTALIGWGRLVKRGFDVISSLLFLVVLSPVFVIIGLAIKLTDPRGPILFRQKRLTRFDQEFTVYKFRSMKQKYSGRGGDEMEIFKKMGRPDLAEEFEKNRGKVANDPRITRVGRILRATSMDELPQFFNVLRGDISLVGPRAIVEHHAQEYKENRSLMLSVKTGITGLAQVSGRDDLSLQERINLDIYYVQNWSFWMDLGIIFKTVYILLWRKGFRS